jgi:4-amino-4-deoxy-L-arabinose transferase-like glycosyltransferase
VVIYDHALVRTRLPQQARLTTLPRTPLLTPGAPAPSEEGEAGSGARGGVGRHLTESPHLIVLGAIVLVGATLRFATLGLQSYRYDEAVTVVRVLHPNFFDTMAAVPGSESTPPLYYAVAWLWSTVLGTAEVQLRSLSALAGTASIVVVYLGARALPLPRRAALIAAGIVAVSPVLIWFSQDARSYSLAFLLGALSFLFFAQARQGSRRDLVWWAICSAVAIATHYFAGFLVAGEAVLLLARREGRSSTVVAVASVAVATALLMPLALEQAKNAHAGWIAEEPVGQRLERAAAKLVGDDNGNEHQQRQPGPIPLWVPVALALASLILLLARGDPAERRSGGAAERRRRSACSESGYRSRSASWAPTISTAATWCRCSCP